MLGTCGTELNPQPQHSLMMMLKTESPRPGDQHPVFWEAPDVCQWPPSVSFYKEVNPVQEASTLHPISDQKLLLQYHHTRQKSFDKPCQGGSQALSPWQPSFCVTVWCQALCAKLITSPSEWSGCLELGYSSRPGSLVAKMTRWGKALATKPHSFSLQNL